MQHRKLSKYTIAAIAIAGGVLNVIRGGALSKFIKGYGKPLHHAAFGLAVWYSCGEVWRGGAAFGLIWLVFTLGWGRLISAAINGYIDPVAEGKKPNLMDRICRPLESHWLPFALFGLTMRGAIIGIPLAALLWQWQLSVAGMMMGYAYVAVGYFFRENKNLFGKHWPDYAWKGSEFVYGTILWLAVFL